MKQILIYAIFFLLQTASRLAIAQIDVSSIDTENGYLFNFDASVYSTPTDLSPEEAINAIRSQSLLKVSKAIAPGFSADFYWIEFTLHSSEDREYIFELSNSHIDKYALYSTEGGISKELYIGGDHYPFDQRAIKNRIFAMPLLLNTGNNTFLLKLDKRNTSIIFPLKVWKPSGFKNHVKNEGVYFGIFFGLICIVVITNLILAGLFRSILYLSYSFYSLLMGLYIFSSLGYSLQFFYPNQPFINDYIRLFITAINIVIGTVFFSSFLNISKYFPGHIRIIRGSISLLVPIFIIWMIFPEWTRLHGVFFINLIYLDFIFVALIIIYSAIKVFPIEKLNVSIFFISSFFAISGAIVTVLNAYGVVDTSIFLLDPLVMGFGIEIFVLAVSMVARAKNLITVAELLKEPDALGFLFEVFYPSGEKVPAVDISYIKSAGHYVEYHLKSSEEIIIGRSTFNDILDQLPSNEFARTHRSYIINLSFVKIKYADKIILQDGLEIPVSRGYKSSINQILNKL